MLKPVIRSDSIRSEIKEAIILLVFAGLLVETLTSATVALVLIGAFMVWLRKRPGRFLRNALTLGIFASYWITYGKVIDPEIGLNFLTSIIVLKLLEKETERDRYMIFFGLILLISAGSLFQKNISYVIFFALSFLILIQDFYRNLRLGSRAQDLFSSFLWVLPFTAILFFLAPRIMNPFQMEKGTPGEGEVGYTPEVNMSQVEGLSSNTRPVFQAIVDRPIINQELYWRGNTLTFSDGWNWPLMPPDRNQIAFDPTLRYEETGIKQSIRTFSQQEFYFGLDHPSYYLSAQGAAALNSDRSLMQNRWKPHQRYQVLSQKGSILDPRKDFKNRIQTGLKVKEKEWIEQTFKSHTLGELESEIQSYFRKEGFSYSLTPGRVESLLVFMRDKKIGFCSHYASAVAQILRAKKIPTRLVSGFMGGTYNRFAGFYLVAQNDAHVWVEAYDEGQWKRLDPTGWIAPDRVQLGGEAYMQQISTNPFSAIRGLGTRFKFLNDFKQWFEQWDFRFFQWLEEMDYYGQEALFSKLQFKREYIFSIVPILLALFMGLYTWSLTRRKTKASELELLWLSFQKKLLKRGITLSLVSVDAGMESLKGKDPRFQDIHQQLIEASFKKEGPRDIRKIKKRIAEL